MRRLVFFRYCVLCLVLVAPTATAAAPCGLIPLHTPSLSFESHQTWRDEDLHIFPNDGERFPKVTGWQAVGAEPLNRHCQRVNGATAVLLRVGAWRDLALTVGEEPVIPVQFFYPSAWSPAQAVIARERLSAVYSRVADLYPLGLDPARNATFTIVATADGVHRVNVRPLDESDVAFLSVLPTDPLFDVQIARLWVRLFTSGRPHPELGPQQRRTKLEKTDLPVDIFDALVEGYAALAAAHEKSGRSNFLYASLLDYFSVAGNLPNPHAPNPLCARPGIGNFISRQTDNGFASSRDRMVYTQCLAPLHSVFLHGLASIGEKASPTLIRDWIREMHGGTYTPSRLPAGRELDGLTWRMTLAKADLASFVQAHELAHDMKLIELPSAGHRPKNERIFSEGAYLDGRLYRKKAGTRADRIFLLTHSYNRVAPRTTHAFDFVAANTVKALLKYGDVFVLHRAHYGETEHALPESYGSCDDPDFQKASQNGAIHIADTARWLKLRRGYSSVIGISRSVGALALLGAAAEGDLAALFIADPVRGAATEDSICSPEKLFPVLERLYEDAKHVPMRLISRRYLLFYKDGRDEKMQQILPNLTWLKGAPERDQADGFFQHPEDWRKEFGEFIRALNQK